MEVDENVTPSSSGVFHTVLAMGNNSDGQLGCGVFWKKFEEGFFEIIEEDGRFPCWLFFLGGRVVGCFCYFKKLLLFCSQKVDNSDR